jgi:peroxiredoxin
VQLQRRLAEFERADTAIYGLSYDPVKVLAAFSSGHGITFPLLSDVGSREIRRLGLLNRHLAQSAAMYGKEVKPHDNGLPYPGTFVLDRAGRVLTKHFEPAYRVRPSPFKLLEAVGAPPPEAAVEASAGNDQLALRAWAAQPFFHPYERLEVHLDLRVAPGLHVYGRPIPDGFMPLEVTVEPLDGLVVGPLRIPAPRPFRVEGLDEAFVVHDGAIAAVIETGIDRPPPQVELEIRVAFQACSETVCHPPSSLTVRLPFEGRDSVREPGQAT